MPHRSDHRRAGLATKGPLAAAVLAAAISFSHGAEPVLADPDTGRWLVDIDRSPRFDQSHLALELIAPTLDGSPIEAVAKLTLASIGSPRRIVELDAKGLEIGSVKVGSKRVAFTHDDDLLAFTLDRPAQPGAKFTVTIEYRITNLDADGVGLSLWDSPRGPVLSSQGEGEHSSKWFPCIDRPDDRLTSEIAFRGPSDLTVLSNGTRTDRRTHRDGTATTRWVMDDHSPVYLVSLAVGDFDATTVGAMPDGEPTVVYAQKALTARDTEVLQRTDDMVKFFALIFDEPYPWDRYDQVYLPGVTWSMEQTTIAFMDGGLLGSDELEDIVAHEVAHHWFGNLVTCRTWEHLWLNEGLASYAELLWGEERARTDDDASTTPETARREYTAAWRRQLFSRPPGRWPVALPMVTARYDDPDQMFEIQDNPYSKGALLLDAVRSRIGDRAFFTGIASYLDQFKWNAAETNDLRRSFERASGQSLERMFDEYTERPGFPVLGAAVEWDSSEGVARVTITQDQLIDQYNPAYELLVPVRFGFSGRERTVELLIDSREVTHEVPLPMEYLSWEIDPDRTLLAGLGSNRSSNSASDAESVDSSNQSSAIDFDPDTSLDNSTQAKADPEVTP